MKKIFFILLLTITTTLYGQNEVFKDSLPALKKGSLELNEKLDNYLKPSYNKNIKYNSENKNVLDLEALREQGIERVKDFKFPPIDVYLGPPVESDTFTRYPFANDYIFNSGYTITNNMWLTSSSVQNTYPTLGAVRTIDVQYNYQPLDWLIISAGPYASKYNLMGNFHNDFGVNGAAKFILHDRIRLNAYGQYSVNGDRNGVQGPMMNMYPQTYYGGTVELKITQKFGIEGGIIRELNPFNGKWVNRPYFAPVFYTK